MKKIILLLVLSCPLLLIAQEEADTIKPFQLNGIAQINFSQASFHNWAKGGENNIGITGIFNVNSKHTMDNSSWENDLKLSYGKIKIGDVVRKSEDLIDFASKYNINATDKLSYSLLFNFKSQFDKGYNYPDDTTIVSKFLAPAFIVVAAGMNFAPTKNLSLFLSPLTGKFTIVSDPGEIDPESYGLEPGETVREEFGAYFKAALEQPIVENVSINTTLELFSNYLDRPDHIDVNWELLLAMTVNKYITASVSTQLIYDHDILVPKESNGVEYMGVGTQFKEIIAIGLAYKFSR